MHLLFQRSSKALLTVLIGISTLHLAACGFGNKEGCKVCRQLGDDFSYGLGVVLMQKWIVQKMDFAGLGATGGYLPSQKLAISVVTTFTADAFDVKGNNKYATASRDIFIEIGEASP